MTKSVFKTCEENKILNLSIYILRHLMQVSSKHYFNKETQPFINIFTLHLFMYMNAECRCSWGGK